MTLLPTHKPPLPSEDAVRSPSSDSVPLAQYLYRPIAFREPDRLVHPPSWLPHIPFAFWIVDALRPQVFVELGTHTGNSYAAFAQAVQMLGLATSAYAVDTWRGDTHAGFYDDSVFIEWADYHDRHFQAFSRLVRSTFDEAADHFGEGTIDLLHIDGCHTYDAVSADFARWLPKLSQRAVIVFHDTNVRERNFGMWRLWAELRERYAAFEFLHGHGLGVIAVGGDIPDAVRWFCSRPSANPADVSAIRQFFATLGGGIVARFTAADLSQKRSDREEQLMALLNNREAELLTIREDLEGVRLNSARLEEQVAHERAGYEADLKHRTRLTAELSERISVETERRRAAEAEQRRLAETAAATSPLAGRFAALTDPKSGAVSHLRRQARHSRDLAKVLRRSFPLIAMHPSRLRDAYTIIASGLFDEHYYRGRYSDVGASRHAPLAHFVATGAREGRNPHPLFDGAYYLRRNPDVAAARGNPLIHYLTHGRYEGRNPHPLFDVAYYLDSNPDVRLAGLEPLEHFLRAGATEGRAPNPFFDCSYYFTCYPDVGQQQVNPLLHFALHGARERRRPSAAFDPDYYFSQNPDVSPLEYNALAHFLEYGRAEGRAPVGADEVPEGTRADLVSAPIALTTTSHAPAKPEPPTILCLSHVLPWPPRAGNEYRIYRMLRWFRDQGYRIVPVVAPLPGERVEVDAVDALAGEFSNAVLCGRDGQLHYILRDVPDVLRSLQGRLVRPASVWLDEDSGTTHERQMLRVDRAFCHDALIMTALRLQEALGSHVLLAEYIWMSRILPLASRDAVKVIDTIDVFSTKRDKVLHFGIDDMHVEAHEESKRLARADLILAIQEDEREALEALAPGTPVVTAGVDVDVVGDGGSPSGRRILYVASDNPMNRKGLTDFLRFAWPHIRSTVPDAELLLAGKVGQTIGEVPAGVKRLGIVDDLRPLYAQARVVINPAVAGTGLKIKTLEALGHLRPVITWPSGTDGFPAGLVSFCTIVKDWYEFSRSVETSLAADAPRLFSNAERDRIVHLTSPQTVYRDVTNALERMLRATANGVTGATARG